MSEPIRVDADALRTTTAAIFQGLGLPAGDADVVTDALLEADLLGVSSHGVSNYIRTIYEPGLRGGTIAARPEVATVHETPVSAVLDGGGGMGHVVGRRAMDLAIAKARNVGVGLVAVRNSRHYGMAGYYALHAARAGLLGLSLTNSDQLVLPTFGREARLGTNPISVAVPGGDEDAFLLDMATSTVPYGKVMLTERAGDPLPEGWATDADARVATDAAAAVQARRLLALGGVRETLGGHKGYGLGALVNVFCGVLSGAGGGSLEGLGGAVGHFFGALRIDLFQSPEVFRAEMDEFLRYLRDTPSADGAPPVIYPGVKEARARADRLAQGVPLHGKVVDYLRGLAGELGVEPAF
jgi:LDH2 family malate/lactate/ureidoglycolate dehydrogenase